MLSGLQQMFAGLETTYGIPGFLLAIALLVLGLIVGRVSRSIVIRFLQAIGFKKITHKEGIDAALHKMGIRGTVTILLGELVKWIFYLIFFALALQTLFGEQFLTDIIVNIATYIPRIIASTIILIVGIIIADIIAKVSSNFIDRLKLDRKGRSALATLSGMIIRLIIIFMFGILALNTLGIEAEILTISLAIVIFALILFLVLGSKDIIQNILGGLYLQSSGTLQKGFKIQCKDVEGKVKEVGFVYTIIDTRKGEVHIPNAMLLKDKIYLK
ncbi:MAG: mechanosensitive ion channel [Candidatus Aenigmarchaeota archaeon]|nr:mechanosensitive ion channel [Candidatus Aenigmarchaeota archaeon]